MLIPILTAVGGVLVLAVLVVVALAARKPDTFRVERAATIHAPPDAVFPLVNDFRTWQAWSPWEKLDPGLQRTYSGPPSGTGAAYEWQGNRKVGAGRMEIKEAVAARRILIQLDFLKPFEAHNAAEFTFAPAAGGTAVTWAMTGRQPFLFKVMTVFLSMEKMVGKDFEAGLANLKAVAER